ncbi:MAG: biotin/lipoyl-binding carrier protein [Leucobacter sp.]|nr:biotin/lipoyl-binding carrier protein [Leucobacter sp.]
MEIKSEMAASVWQVVVAEGDEVAEGDTLLVLESMKMEIPVEAPKAGKVSSLLVKAGDTVDEYQVLAILD